MIDKQQLWTVYYKVTDDGEAYERKFSLEIKDDVPNFNYFKKQVAKTYHIRKPFEFRDIYSNLVDSSNIIDSYREDNPILAVHIENEALKQYEFKINLHPSKKFQQNQRIRYNTRSALCELLDNSIQYTNEQEKRCIRITKKEDEIIIEDNGSGMTAEKLEVFAKLAEKGFEEEALTSEYVQDFKEHTVLKYLDFGDNLMETILNNIHQVFSSFLSKWGTGAKLAMDKLGRYHIVKSTTPSDEKVWTMELDRDTTTWNGKRGDMFKSLDDYMGGFHYTIITISELTKFDTEENILLHRLAHIYYFYTNGYTNFIKLALKRIYNHIYCKNKLKESMNIALKYLKEPLFENVDMKYNNESLRNDEIMNYYKKSSSAFPFYFSYTLSPPEINTVANSDGKYFKYIAFGFVFYFPYQDHELFPEDEPRVEYYWLGRLLPEEDALLPFMKEENCKRVMPHIIRRTKALIFLNRAFIPTPEKNRLLEKEKENILSIAANPKLQSSFTDWVKDCHKTFDKELQFDKFITEIPSEDDEDIRILRWGVLKTMENRSISQGDYVCLKNRSKKKDENIYGKVVYFQYRKHAGSHVSMDHEIIMNPCPFIWMKEQSFAIETYEIEAVDSKDIQKIKKAYIPAEIHVLEDKRQNRYTKSNSKKHFELTTADKELNLRACLFKKSNDTVLPSSLLSYFVLSWKLVVIRDENESENEESNYILPSQDEITAESSKKFIKLHIQTATLIPNSYNLHIKCIVPNAFENFTIEKVITIDIASSAPKELKFKHKLEEFIKLGVGYEIPPLLLYDTVGMPIRWDTATNYPTITLHSSKYIISKKGNLKFKIVDGVEAHSTPLIIKIKKGLLLEKSDKVNLEISFETIKKYVSIFVLPGPPRVFSFEGLSYFPNNSSIDVTIISQDKWGNNTTNEEIELEDIETNTTYNLAMTNTITCDVHKPLYKYFTTSVSTNPEIKLLGQPLIIRDKTMYYAFSVDGVIYQSGDYCKIIFSGKNSFAMIRYVEESEDSKIVHCLYLMDPLKTTKTDPAFKNIHWSPRELCLTDWHFPSNLLEHPPKEKISVLSECQFNAISNYASNVYFVRYAYSEIRDIEKKNDVIFKLEGNNGKSVSFLFVIGGRDGISKLTDNSLIKKKWKDSDTEFVFHSTSMQWALNGEFISMDKLIQTKIPPGSFVYCFPGRGCIGNNSNSTITMQIKEDPYLTNILLINKPILITPSETPSYIDIQSVNNPKVSCEKNCITGVCGEEFQVKFETYSETNINFSKDISSIEVEYQNNEKIMLKLHSFPKFTSLTIPNELGEHLWKFTAIVKGYKIHRSMKVISKIGAPAKLTVDKIEHKASLLHVDSNSGLYNLQNDMKYTISFNIYDARDNRYDRRSWEENECYISEFKEGILGRCDAGTSSITIETISNSLQTIFPPACNISLVAPEGKLQITLIAKSKFFTFEKDITTEIIEVNITPGNPVKIKYPVIPFKMKTYEDLDIITCLLDTADNQVYDSSIVLRLKDPTWDESNLQFTYKDGWYSKTLQFIAPKTHKIQIEGKDSRKSGRGIKLPIISSTIDVEQADNITFGISLESNVDTIIAGSKFPIKYMAITKDNKPLPGIPVTSGIKFKDKVFKEDDILTEVGKYTFMTGIDKDYTVNRKFLKATKSFEVIAGKPASLSYTPRLEKSLMLSSGSWLWDDTLSIKILDKFGNVCIQENNTFISIDIKDSDSFNSIINEIYNVRQGSCLIDKNIFTKHNWEGSYTIIFTYAQPDCEIPISDNFDFSTNVDARTVKSQLTNLHNHKRTKEKELRELELKFENSEFNQRNFNTKMQRKEILTEKFKELQKQREGFNEPSNVFKVYFDIIQDLRVFRNHSESFLGNMSSLACIGNMETSFIWTDESLKQFNEELTLWIGIDTLKSIVVHHPDKEKEEEIIYLVRKEIGSNIRLRMTKLNTNPIRYKTLNNSQSHIDLGIIPASGFIGFAVNLLFLDKNQLELKLRERLWFDILKRAMVFDTAENLKNYCKQTRDVVFAFSLDGYHRRGNSIVLNPAGGSKKEFAFSKPANSAQRQQIQDELQDIQIYERNRLEKVKNISKLTNDIQNIDKKISTIGSNIDDLHSPSNSVYSQPISQEKTSGIAAEGFSVPSKRKRVVATRGRPSAKRGRY